MVTPINLTEDVDLFANPGDRQPMWVLADSMMEAQELFKQALSFETIPFPRRLTALNVPEPVAITALAADSREELVLTGQLWLAQVKNDGVTTVVCSVPITEYMDIQDLLAEKYLLLAAMGVCIVSFDDTFSQSLGKYFVADNTRRLQYIADQNFYIVYDVRDAK